LKALSPDRNPQERLPDSDLLKAVHVYASDFYARAIAASEEDAMDVDYNSMDGTALLAMGLLLEESCRGKMGENGQDVFVEAKGKDEEMGVMRKSRARSTSDAARRSGETRRKRRKLEVESDRELTLEPEMEEIMHESELENILREHESEYE
jgi:hypothetical protein